MNTDIGHSVELDPVATPIEDGDWFGEIQVPTPAPTLNLDAESAGPPAPDPTPPFLPSEVAGMVLGSVMVMLGVTYVFWVL